MSGEPLVTTFAVGQSVTVKMGRTVNNDPKNPFGIDLIVYGNSFFSATGGGFGGDSTNLNTTTVGGLFAENVRVSVSPDNVNWYSYPTDAAHTGDGYYPTNSYLWNRTGTAWTDTEADPTKPVDPSIGTAASLARPRPTCSIFIMAVRAAPGSTWPNPGSLRSTTSASMG